MAKPAQADIDAILGYKDLLVRNAMVLRKRDPNDYYWRDLTDPSKLLRNGVLLETNMVTSWIAATRKPRRILEIGTRSGGSLIALLSAYPEAERSRIETIVSFDLWREYLSTTGAATGIAKLMGRSSNMNFTALRNLFPGAIAAKAENKIKDNLRAFGLPTDKIRFVAGNSKVTVPAFFKAEPHAQFDYILVDGAHDEETAAIDLENTWAHCAPGGIVVFDDIMPESYGLIGVWNAFKLKHGDAFDFFEVEHRKGVAWAIRKPASPK
ncbi:MAG: class I SAM-dependent methyltransferase [Bacteroidetes bacterium]|nr:class I SAM-dependent methyltransferase [Bacteroidota bacterium]MBS1942658.1 class I SAM-dependent methyltransferase [Bacteroidota bacterium]